MSILENELVKDENVIKPISVGELIKHQDGKPNFSFFIPSYQRGYRWDNLEVTALLDDIFEFIQNKKLTSEKYCLQPVVVKYIEGNTYEVLDGQQRLTTLFILLSRLKVNDDEITIFDLEYETRPNSKTFLGNLNLGINKDNPDYYYISNAYQIISDWLELNKAIPRLKGKIYEALIENIDFIWYEIKDSSINPIDVFTRINIGKIPLTNAELVKAVFLSKNNLALGLDEDLDASYDNVLSHRQSLIAMEWDQMEKQLQDEDFWFFIFNGNEKNYETRIDYLLDLITKKVNNEKNLYYSFQVIYNRVKEIRLDHEQLNKLRKLNNSFIEQEWADLKQYFDILNEWYNNKVYNHLIGILILSKHNILSLLDLYRNNNRKEFLNIVIDEVVRKIGNKPLSDLRFTSSQDYKIIYRTLILHNILHALKQPDTSKHFPFEKIKNDKKWSLEHIYAQNSDDIKEEDQSTWVSEHKNHFEIYYHEEIDLIGELASMEFKQNVERDVFLKLFEKVNQFVQGKIDKIEVEEARNYAEDFSWTNDEHSIANLTLLDVSTNSYLSNSVFGLKREKIKDKDRELVYIPNETRKVFFKYYSEGNRHDAYWTFNDRVAYFKDIEKTITELKALKKL